MNHRLYKTEKLLSKVAKGGFFNALFYPRAKIRQSVGIKMVVRLERSEPICLARFTALFR